MTIRANDISGSTPVSAIAVGTTASSKNRLYRNAGKRALDMVLVLGSAIFVAPVILLLAALVALDGHNPFYWQSRVGLNGRSFRLWKLRTMVPKADEKLEAYLAANPDAREEWDTTQKLKSDPRITRVGRILRKSSLDELPQLINVLLGDMSLVGPRPMMEAQREMYPGKAYYRMRPGITGTWQISDRNDCSFRGRAQFDDLYEQKITLREDVRILKQTFSVVFRCTGY
ncbi:sugar transferase [Dinoroseobacter sp. S124A]|uniref:sugar transferase n=1 Tax=Dinoroseobacter sp. S124A TaxID=3415128 RepID=UPI003C7D69FF